MDRIERITEIPEAKYQGYIWYSDCDRPKVLTGDEEYGGTLDPTANPFIIEGNLWDEDTRTSVSIRYVDGQYYIHQTKLTAEGLKKYNTYVAHRIDDYKYLRFAQLWETRKDPMCENMEVLEPSKLVFIGFTNSEK